MACGTVKRYPDTSNINATVSGQVTLKGLNIAGSDVLAQLISGLTVSATDLDIRNLVFATDKVDVSGSTVELVATTLAALEPSL